MEDDTFDPSDSPAPWLPGGPALGELTAEEKAALEAEVAELDAQATESTGH